MFGDLVPGGGFEPPTRRFSVVCSTPELPGQPCDDDPLRGSASGWKGAYGEGFRALQEGFLIFLLIILCKLVQVHTFTGHSIAIVEPAGEVTIFAPAGTKWRKFF